MDEEQAKPVSGLVIGGDLSDSSVEELEARITLLRAEIERVEAAIESKKRSRGEADSFFRT